MTQYVVKWKHGNSYLSTELQPSTMFQGRMVTFRKGKPGNKTAYRFATKTKALTEIKVGTVYPEQWKVVKLKPRAKTEYVIKWATLEEYLGTTRDSYGHRYTVLTKAKAARFPSELAARKEIDNRMANCGAKPGNWTIVAVPADPKLPPPSPIQQVTAELNPLGTFHSAGTQPAKPSVLSLEPMPGLKFYLQKELYATTNKSRAHVFPSRNAAFRHLRGPSMNDTWKDKGRVEDA